MRFGPVALTLGLLLLSTHMQGGGTPLLPYAAQVEASLSGAVEPSPAPVSSTDGTADIVAGIESRNQVESVQAAHLALKNALAALEAA